MTGTTNTNNQMMGVGNVALFNSSAASDAVYVIAHSASWELTDAREMQMAKTASGATSGIFTGSGEVTGTFSTNSTPTGLVTAICGYALTDTTATSQVTASVISGTAAYQAAQVAAANDATPGTYLVKGAANAATATPMVLRNGLVDRAESMPIADAKITITPSNPAPAAEDFALVVIYPTAIPERATYDINVNQHRPAVSVVMTNNTFQDLGEITQVYLPRVKFGELGMSAATDTIAEQAYGFTAIADAAGSAGKVTRYRVA